MRLSATRERIELSVSDTGSAVPDDTAAKLFREPVDRGEGLGIGLYNVARLAESGGYDLRLAENNSGDVRFALERER